MTKMKKSITYKELADIISLMLNKNKVFKKRFMKEHKNDTSFVVIDDMIDPDELLKNVKLYMRGLHKGMNEKQLIKLIVKNTKSF